jgi:hypothetical protein
MFVLPAGGETYRSLWAKMVRNAAHVACAALNEVREENSKQSVPPNGTFEVGTTALGCLLLAAMQISSCSR